MKKMYGKSAPESGPYRDLRRKSGATAGRLSLLPGFLSRGFKSANIPKDNINPEKFISACLEENLGGLLQKEDPPEPSETQSSHHKSSIRSPPPGSPEQNNSIESTRIKNKSKSVFQEINSKYTSLKIDENQGEEKHDFNARLLSKLSRKFIPKQYHLKEEILGEITILDELLVQRYNMSLPRKRAFNTSTLDEGNKENVPIKFPCVPKSKWVFQTPPNRKLNFRNVNTTDNGDILQPGVLHTCRNQKILYEVNNKVKIDLSNFVDRQEVSIDKRYLVEAGKHNDEEEKKMFHFSEQTTTEGDTCDPFELEQHFLSLTCRPKKTSTATTRIPNLKRKRDLFETGSPNISLEELEAPIYSPPNMETTAVEDISKMEESFDFKFCSEWGNAASTSGRLFDFSGENDPFNMSY